MSECLSENAILTIGLIALLLLPTLGVIVLAAVAIRHDAGKIS